MRDMGFQQKVGTWGRGASYTKTRMVAGDVIHVDRAGKAAFSGQGRTVVGAEASKLAASEAGGGMKPKQMTAQVGKDLAEARKAGGVKAERRAARAIAGEGGRRSAAATLNTLKTAKRIKTFARIATWAPLAYMAFDLVSSLSDMPAPNAQAIPRKSGALSGTFVDTGLAYTQRRRALEAMSGSQYAGRSALGNEASLMHR
jgi:hypothetical protein